MYKLGNYVRNRNIRSKYESRRFSDTTNQFYYIISLVRVRLYAAGIFDAFNRELYQILLFNLLNKTYIYTT